MNAHAPEHSILRPALQCFIAATGLLGAALACAELPAWAPGPKPRVVEDRLRAEVNFMFASVDTQLRVDPSQAQQGTLVDTEDDLGLDDTEMLLQAELTLLPGEHHLIRLSGLTTRRTGRVVLDRQLIFDDQVYLPGDRVDSRMDINLFGLTYGYRFYAGNRAEVTGTFGIQIAAVETNARSRSGSATENGVAPLPLIGMEGRYDFTYKWSVEARLQYLSAYVDNVDGAIVDGRLAVTWRMNPYLVLGLGYRKFSVNIDSDNDDTPGLVDMQLAGPLLFARGSM